jgi:hypothetical protein
MLNTIEEVKRRAKELYRDVVDKETIETVSPIAILQKQLSLISDSIKDFAKRDETAQIVRHPELSSSGAAIVTESNTSDLTSMEIIDHTKVGYIFESDEDNPFLALSTRPSYACELNIPKNFKPESYLSAVQKDYFLNILFVMDFEQLMAGEQAEEFNPTKYEIIISNVLASDISGKPAFMINITSATGASLIGLAQGEYSSFSTLDSETLKVTNPIGWFLQREDTLIPLEEDSQIESVIALLNGEKTNDTTYQIVDYLGLLSDNALAEIAESFGVTLDQAVLKTNGKIINVIKDFFISTIDKSLYLNKIDLVKGHPALTKINQKCAENSQDIAKLATNISTNTASLDRLLYDFDSLSNETGVYANSVDTALQEALKNQKQHSDAFQEFKNAIPAGAIQNLAKPISLFITEQGTLNSVEIELPINGYVYIKGFTTAEQMLNYSIEVDVRYTEDSHYTAVITKDVTSDNNRWVSAEFNADESFLKLTTLFSFGAPEKVTIRLTNSNYSESTDTFPCGMYLWMSNNPDFLNLELEDFADASVSTASIEHVLITKGLTDIKYDNKISGLDATTIKEAVDELATRAPNVSDSGATSTDVVQIVDTLDEATSDIAALRNELSTDLAHIGIINHEDIGYQSDWENGPPDMSNIIFTDLTINLLTNFNSDAYTEASGKDSYYNILIVADASFTNLYQIIITNLEFTTTSEKPVGTIIINDMVNEHSYYGIPQGEYNFGNDNIVTVTDPFGWVHEVCVETDGNSSYIMQQIPSDEAALIKFLVDAAIVVDLPGLLTEEELSDTFGEDFPLNQTTMRMTDEMLEVIKDLAITKSPKSLYDKSGTDLIASHNVVKAISKKLFNITSDIVENSDKTDKLASDLYQLRGGFNSDGASTGVYYSNIDDTVRSMLLTDKWHSNSINTINASISNIQNSLANMEGSNFDVKYSNDTLNTTTVKEALDELTSTEYKDSLAEYIISKIPNGDEVQY